MLNGKTYTNLNFIDAPIRRRLHGIRSCMMPSKVGLHRPFLVSSMKTILVRTSNINQSVCNGVNQARLQAKEVDLYCERLPAISSTFIRSAYHMLLKVARYGSRESICEKVTTGLRTESVFFCT